MGSLVPPPDPKWNSLAHPTGINTPEKRGRTFPHPFRSSLPSALLGAVALIRQLRVLTLALQSLAPIPNSCRAQESHVIAQNGGEKQLGRSRCFTLAFGNVKFSGRVRMLFFETIFSFPSIFCFGKCLLNEENCDLQMSATTRWGVGSFWIEQTTLRLIEKTHL